MKGGAYKRRGGLDGLIHADRALASMKGSAHQRRDFRQEVVGGPLHEASMKGGTRKRRYCVSGPNLKLAAKRLDERRRTRTPRPGPMIAGSAGHRGLDEGRRHQRRDVRDDPTGIEMTKPR
ncbi:hypothetical protein [Microbispora rosea]|uniref:hypothetical protein n=1 Tax=Microbispora rosea TaxID=58117 RepID=UPI003D8DB0FE